MNKRVTVLEFMIVVAVLAGAYWWCVLKPKRPVATSTPPAVSVPAGPIVVSHVPGGEVTYTVDVQGTSHEAQVYAELWNLCKKNHLFYQVNWGVSGYYGAATAAGETYPEIVTEEFTGPTQAAERLIMLIHAHHDHFSTGVVRP